MSVRLGAHNLSYTAKGTVLVVYNNTQYVLFKVTNEEMADTNNNPPEPEKTGIKQAITDGTQLGRYHGQYAHLTTRATGGYRVAWYQRERV